MIFITKSTSYVLSIIKDFLAYFIVTVSSNERPTTGVVAGPSYNVNVSRIQY